MFGNYQFGVTCNYETSIEAFPDNDPSDFVYQFDKEMKLEGEWEVCLSSAVMPPNVYADYGVCGVKIGEHTIELDPDHYKHGSSVVKELFYYLKSVPELDAEFTIYHSAQNNSWCLYRREKSLAENENENEEDKVIPVIISPCYNYIVDGNYVRREIHTVPGTQILWDKLSSGPNIQRLKVNTAILYSDLVTDSWLGTTPAPLLDIIPFGNLLKTQATEMDILEGPNFSYSTARVAEEETSKDLAEKVFNESPFDPSDFVKRKIVGHEQINNVLTYMREEGKLENLPQLYVPKERTFRQLRSNEFSTIRFVTRSVDGTPISLMTGLNTLDKYRVKTDLEDTLYVDREKIYEKYNTLKGTGHKFEVTLLFTRVA